MAHRARIKYTPGVVERLICNFNLLDHLASLLFLKFRALAAFRVQFCGLILISVENERRCLFIEHLTNGGNFTTYVGVRSY